MSNRWRCLAFFASLGVSICTLIPPNLAAQQDNERIATLIKQLGSDKYAEREAATRELDAIGVPSLPLLRAAVKLDNLEARRRALDLVKKLEDKLASEALLTPKMVKLSFKNISVMQAVEELRKQSGYTIFVEGDNAHLHERKISLETGEVTFWVAFDKLCEVGNLVEIQAESPLKKYYTSPMAPAWQVMPPPLPVKGGVQALPPPLIKGQIAPLPVNGQVAAAKGQALPAPVPALPPQPFQMVAQVTFTGFVPDDAGTAMIVVRDGTPEKLPTVYCGALRIRMLRLNSSDQVFVAPPEVNQALFTVLVSREPRLQQFSVIAGPRITKALDDLGQALVAMSEPIQSYDDERHIVLRSQLLRGRPDLDHTTTLRLKLGDKKAGVLKNVVGSLPVQALSASPEAFITIGDVMNAIGQTVSGKQGGMIELIGIAKQNDGTYSVKIRYQTPPNHFPASNEMGGIIEVGDPYLAQAELAVRQQQLRIMRDIQQRINGQAGAPYHLNEGLPVLVDAKGKVLKLKDAGQRSFREINGQIVQEMTLIFRTTEGVGPPAQMVLYGHRMVSATVPFRFENVPLP